MRIFLFLETAVLFSLLTGIPFILHPQISGTGFIKEPALKSVILFWFALYVVKILRIKRMTLSHTSITQGVILFLLISSASLFFSDYKLISANVFENTFYFIILFFLVTQFFGDHDIGSFTLKAALTGAFIISITGIIQFFQAYLISNGENMLRAFATLGHPNFLAGYLVGLLPLTIGFFLSMPQKKRKYYYAVSIFAQTACLILTFSRSAVASLLAAVIFFALVYIIQRRRITRLFKLNKKKVAVVLIIAMVLTAASLLVFKTLPEHEISRLTALNINAPSPLNTFWMRWNEWKGALEVIKKNPFGGNGLGTFSIFFPIHQPVEFASVSTERDEFLRHAHNEYLEIWCEMGLLGVLAFAWIIFSAIFSGIKLLRETVDKSYFIFLGLVSGLVGMSVGMLFSVAFRFVVGPLFFWFYLGTINGHYQGRMKKSKEYQLSGKKLYALIPLFVCLMIILSFILGKSISHYKAEIYFHKGLANFNAGYPEESIYNFQQALDYNKSKPEIYYKKGAAEVRLKKWSEALNTYTLLQAMHPNFFHINFNLSLCFLSTGDTKNAIVSGNRQIERFPAFKDQYYVLGKAHYTENNLDEAEKCFSKYLELDPESASALNYLGMIYASRSEWAMSLRQYKKILDYHPQNFHALLNISRVYAEMGDMEASCDNLYEIFARRDQSGFFQKYRENIASIIDVIIKKMDRRPLKHNCAEMVEYFEAIKKEPS